MFINAKNADPETLDRLGDELEKYIWGGVGEGDGKQQWYREFDMTYDDDHPTFGIDRTTYSVDFKYHRADKPKLNDHVKLEAVINKLVRMQRRKEEDDRWANIHYTRRDPRCDIASGTCCQDKVAFKITYRTRRILQSPRFVYVCISDEDMHLIGHEEQKKEL
jgi:hypothetical protein